MASKNPTTICIKTTIDELTDNSIPHVIMTSEGVWNPRVVDDNINETIEEMIKKFPPTPK